MAPLGISFYIFQISSYVIDIHRNRLLPTKNFIVFSAFASYFPHMAAGPIMPAKDLIPQIESNYRKIERDELMSAISLIANGLVRKVVIADTLAPMVNRVFGSPANFDWRILILATLGFALQIYGDFSGYSNMARGISRLLGIELLINFKQPYLSRNIQDFWRRWHISLSNWFKDYLYIPLGGNRGTTIKTSFNLILVMVLAGLWHGAGIGFLLWGFLHGLGLAVFHMIRNRSRVRVKKFRLPHKILSIFVTNVFVMLLWIPFRLPETTSSIDFLTSIVSRQGGVFEIPDLVLVIQMLFFTLILDVLERAWLDGRFRVNSILYSQPTLFGILIGIAFALIAIFSSSQVTPFIYFQF